MLNRLNNYLCYNLNHYNNMCYDLNWYNNSRAHINALAAPTLSKNSIPQITSCVNTQQAVSCYRGTYPRTILQRKRQFKAKSLGC